ncbi:MAG: metalloregulator ArsR/SmtB family transcription factor [Betaproteobacteria bacterium]
MNPASATTTDSLSAAFAALADPTRRAILARLAQGETRVGELVKPFPISGPAISRHLRVLENARLIERKVDAQWRICRLHPPGLRAADDWLSQYRVFWEDRLDRLVEVLESDANGVAADAGLAPGPLAPKDAPAVRNRRGPRTTPTRPATRNRRAP